jgi:hypothetical protein
MSPAYVEIDRACETFGLRGSCCRRVRAEIRSL